MSISGGCATGPFCLIQDHWLNVSACLERPMCPEIPCLSRHTMPLKLWPPSAAPSAGLITLPRGCLPQALHLVRTHLLHAPQKERASYFITSMTIFAIIYSNYGTCSRPQNLFAKKGLRPAAPLYKPGRSEGECRVRGGGGPPFPQRCTGAEPHLSLALTQAPYLFCASFSPRLCLRAMERSWPQNRK